MKKKILALALTVALCTMTCETAFAASSSTSGSSSSSSGSSSSSEESSSSESTSAPSSPVAAQPESPATRGTENTNNVAVAIKNADGSVSTVNLTQYTEQTNNSVVAVAAAAIGANPGEAVSAVMTTPASELFKATINALGGNIRMVNAGGYKVTALAPGADGRIVASVGTVKGVTKYAFVLLISVNEDGTTEIVEGTVDPVTLQVMGAFTGTPRTITVSVVMAR